MLHVLLVEDNPGDVRLIREAIRTSPIATDVVVATDGEQALKYLRIGWFDLVILDLNLPKADGHAVFRHYGTSEGAPPIVVFSSSSNDWDRNQALGAGAKQYVVKPFLLDEFIRAVHAILSRP